MEDLIRSLPKLLRAAGDAKEVSEAVALVAWKRVAGEGLRNHAVPLHLYGKTLVVAVADTTWQKQLEAVSGELLFRLNSLLGHAVVTFIQLRVDPKTIRAERATRAAEQRDREQEEVRAIQHAAGEISRAAEAIQDEHLRYRFLVAAGSCIDRLERD